MSIKRALISVSNKSGIIEFAQNLASLNIEILSTQLLMGQLLINILIVSLISIYQRLNLMQRASS